MNQLNENTRRIGGLLLEVLVFVFVFSGSCLDVEVFNKREVTIKTSPVPGIVFRDPNSSAKSHTECNDKPNNSHSHYTLFFVAFGSQKIVCASGLAIGSSLYNIFYTHLTALAP